jgi:hypothetical protein
LGRRGAFANQVSLQARSHEAVGQSLRDIENAEGRQSKRSILG